MLVKKKNARRAATQSEHQEKYLNHTVTEKRRLSNDLSRPQYVSA